ncbi:helicase [Paucimonas lemoignei]|nr:helicase [Paucimonas lemoignei]
MKHKRPALLKRAVFYGYDYGLFLIYIEGSNRPLLVRQGYFICCTERPQQRAWRIHKTRIRRIPSRVFIR